MPHLSQIVSKIYAGTLGSANASTRILGVDGSNQLKIYSIAEVGSVPSSYPVLDTVAVVGSTSIPVGWQSIRTAGYYAAGDGGGALYKRVGGAPSHGLYIQSSDGAYWEHADTEIWIRSTGAKGDGSTDDTTNIQKAFNKGGVINFTPGTYKVTGTLNYISATTRVRGAGISSTSLVFQNGSSNCLVCDALNSCSLENIKLTGTSKTGGAFLVVTGGAYLFYANRIYYNNGWNGLDFNKINSALVENSACGGGMGGDWAIRFTGDSGFKSDVLTLRSIGLANAGGPSTFAGILWDSYAHTLELEDFRIVRCGYGILTQRTTGSDSNATPSFLNATKLEIDFPTKEAILLNYMNDAWINNLYASGGGTSTEVGVNIGAACSSIRIHNGRISGAGKHGVLVAGINTILNGLRIYANGQAASNTYSGVYVDTTATDVVLSASDIGRTSSETQKWGLEIAAGAQRYTYQNCIINGNQVGAISPQTDLIYNAGGTFRHVFKSESSTHLHVGGSANAAVEYLRIAGANAGGNPTILAEGASSNLDIAITPKGSGVLRFGTWTADEDAAVNGYITVKSSDGTSRKIATIA